MIILSSCKELKDKFENIVVGLGNFDGVHVGHQKLVKQVVNTATTINGTAVIFTFDPHPLSILDPENAPPKLLSPQGKMKIMEQLGVAVIISLPFSAEFAKITAADFIKDILYKEMAVKTVVVGYNYTFGNRGMGNVQTLEECSSQYGYNLHVIAPVSIDGQVVSSTYIRELLLKGDVERATKFLGYHPYVEGVVVTGDRRGNNVLGFPTANLNLDQCLLVPANGVYSVSVELKDKQYLGLANIGTKPTFSKQRQRNLEVHLLDFKQDIYGKKINVKFLRRLRNEKRFNSVNDLISQINQDIQMVLQDRM